MRRTVLLGLVGGIALTTAACGLPWPSDGTVAIAGQCVRAPVGSYQCYPTTTTASTLLPPTSTTTAEQPNFTLAAEPANQEVKHGGSVTYTVKVQGNTTFNERVSFAVSDLPAGSTGVFSPGEAGSGESSILTVKTSRGATKSNSYQLTISGTTPSGLSDSTTVTLTVTR